MWDFKSPQYCCLLSSCLFMSANTCYLYLSAPMLGPDMSAYISNGTGRLIWVLESLSIEPKFPGAGVSLLEGGVRSKGVLGSCWCTGR